METVVLPWIQETYGDRDVAWCFQQVRLTMNMCKSHVSHFMLFLKHAIFLIF